MELIAIQTFLAVVEEGGILAASRKLNTVQSNVTTRIRRLEEELGNELFHRQGRGLKLAPAGRVLKDYAEQMQALVHKTQNAVSQVGQQTGELRIGSMESFAAINLAGALKQDSFSLKLMILLISSPNAIKIMHLSWLLR